MTFENEKDHLKPLHFSVLLISFFFCQHHHGTFFAPKSKLVLSDPVKHMSRGVSTGSSVANAKKRKELERAILILIAASP